MTMKDVEQAARDLENRADREGSDLQVLKVLGHEIGLHSGWDQGDVGIMIFYDYEPNELFKPFMPRGTITIDFNEGTVITYDDSGEINRQENLIKVFFKAYAVQLGLDPEVMDFNPSKLET